MENSPFNRSSRTARTPPPTPSSAPVSSPRPQVPNQAGDPPQMISTSEIQSWMTSIEQCLNELCTIASEGKLNSDQKLRINNLCRKVGHGTSQMAVQYQSLKLKTVVQAYSTVQTLQDENDLADTLKELKRSIEESSKPAPGKSFAEMVKKGTNNYVQPANFSSVVIYPNDKLKSSEETKSMVQKIICPEQLKLHVRGLRKTKNGGVIISTETKNDIEKLKQTVQLANTALNIDENIKRKPRIVIIGVPTALSEKEFFKCLYEQNLAEQQQDLSIETFLNSTKLSHKSGKKGADTCNYIIEVTAGIRRALISKERLYINWSSCPVKDFTMVTRCYKCQQYGHAAKTCREQSYTCGHCSVQGHTINECLKINENPRCATCVRYKKPDRHNTGAPDCPAKLMAERKYIQSVDYGGI